MYARDAPPRLQCTHRARADVPPIRHRQALERATELLESKQGDEMLCVNSLTEGVRAIFISFTHLGPLANSEPPNEFEQAINFRYARVWHLAHSL